MPIRKYDEETRTLLSNGSASGNAVKIPGGEYALILEGTLGGATMGLQMQSPSGAWVPVESFAGGTVTTHTTPVCITPVKLPACNVKAVVTGGTPSALYAYLQGMG